MSKVETCPQCRKQELTLGPWIATIRIADIAQHAARSLHPSDYPRQLQRTATCPGCGYRIVERRSPPEQKGGGV